MRDDRTVELAHGKPVRFGKDGNKGLRLNAELQPEVVTVGVDGVTESDVMVWDVADPSPARAMALSSMSETAFPVPIGVFRDVARPAFEDAVRAQLNAAKEKGTSSLQSLLEGPDTWRVG